ncbi:hypothetical protein GGF46_004514 [Coemansia sp. RSA 552]|nr:hypothetical protein GGF46_004514 [Coemansia sp. RSA 552]
MQATAGSPSDDLLAGHAKATLVGGRRKSRGVAGTLRKEDSSSDEGSDEENDSKDVIHKGEQDNQFFLQQIEEKQKQKHMQKKFPNDAISRKPAVVKDGMLRQPGAFPKGTPKAFKEAAQERSSK